jgi:predicted metal-dependent hydrolase
MIHLIEPTHNDRFLTILGAYYPHWREARTELNALPLTDTFFLIIVQH